MARPWRIEYPGANCHVLSRGSLLEDRLWLRSCEYLLETRIASQRIPFPPETKIGERDVIRKIRTLDRSGDGKQTLNQGNGLVRLADQRINQGQTGHMGGAVKCVLAFRLEFDRPASFTQGVVLPLHVGVEDAKLVMARGVVGIVAHPFFGVRPHRGKMALGCFEVAASAGETAVVKRARGFSTRRKIFHSSVR